MSKISLAIAMQLALFGAAVSGVAAQLTPEQKALCRLPYGPGADAAAGPEDVAAVLGVDPVYAWYPDQADDSFIKVLYVFSQTTMVVVDFAQSRRVAGTQTGAGGPSPSGEVGDTFWASRGISTDGYIGFDEPDWNSEACLAVYGCGTTIPWGSSSHCPLIEGCGDTIPWGSEVRCPCPSEAAIAEVGIRPPGC